MVHDSVENLAVSTDHTILVVDDDPVVTKAMQVLLQRAGFATIGCLNGADAMSKAAAKISAAVVDIHLPDINGLDLSQQLRHVLGPLAPIVILSGDNSIETIRSLPRAEATYFFSKPVNTGMLVNQLRDWLSI